MSSVINAPRRIVPHGLRLQSDAHPYRGWNCRARTMVVCLTVVHRPRWQEIGKAPVKKKGDRMDGICGKLFDEFPADSNWDVVVIGGGPNGLMTAAYLAKAGAKVAVVERRYEVGGGLATEEVLFPCYYSNMHAIYHMMVDYMPAMKDFDLERHALTWIKPNLQMAMVFGDGSTLLLTKMIEDTVDSIHKYSHKDAVAFGRHMRVWQRT